MLVWGAQAEGGIGIVGIACGHADTSAPFGMSTEDSWEAPHGATQHLFAHSFGCPR